MIPLAQAKGNETVVSHRRERSRLKEVPPPIEGAKKSKRKTSPKTSGTLVPHPRGLRKETQSSFVSSACY